MADKRESRTDYLNSLLRSWIGESATEDLNIMFKGRGGWVVAGSPRWIGDDGEEFLGHDWRAAEIELTYIYKPRK